MWGHCSTHAYTLSPMPTETTEKTTGSRARDHLANERTFLAWVRTALGAIGLGLALDKVLIEEDTQNHTGILFILLGAIFLISAVRRYYRVAKDLDSGLFAVDRKSPLILIILCLLVVLGALALSLS